MTGDWAGLNVSRETSARLEVFEQLVHKWNPHINLVSRGSLSEFRTRHLADSIQVFRSATKPTRWADLGSGGGFPGLVVAILAKDEVPDLEITLIESDQRKSTFLRTVIREIGLECHVLSGRIEKSPPLRVDTLSARALAPLHKLLEYAERHLASDGVALFPKGINWQAEVTAALRQWHFQMDVIESQTKPGAAILKIKGASRV